MKHKIVFIDDESDLCELYVDLFGSNEVQINSFTSCKEALSFLEVEQVHLCFIDFRMPEMSGFELRKKISSEVPCVLLTGELMSDVEEGFVRVVSKPMDVGEFESLVEEFCVSG